MQKAATLHNSIAFKESTPYANFEVPYQPLKLTVANPEPEFEPIQYEEPNQDPVHPNTDDLSFINHMSAFLFGQKVPYRSVLLTHDKGQISTVQISDVKLIFSKGSSVFVYANSGYHRINDTLSQLMASELDPEVFYRISKDCIIHFEAVHYITPLSNGDIAVQVFVPNHPAIIVSKEHVKAFEAWINQAESKAIHTWYAG